MKRKLFKLNNPLGFTLIELLVVIMIIGILATIISISIINSAKKARDAKRTADVNSVKTALGQYFEDYGSYPQCSDVPIPTTPCALTNDGVSAALRPFLNSMPVDPGTKISYDYTRTSSSAYTIHIVYETKTNNDCYTGVGVPSNLTVCD